MDALNQLEIQNIRHICSLSGNVIKKIEYYKTLTNDEKATNLLEKSANELSSLKSSLCNML